MVEGATQKHRKGGALQNLAENQGRLVVDIGWQIYPEADNSPHRLSPLPSKDPGKEIISAVYPLQELHWLCFWANSAWVFKPPIETGRTFTETQHGKKRWVSAKK